LDNIFDLLPNERGLNVCDPDKLSFRDNKDEICSIVGNSRFWEAPN
jgi:hypothetical protein